MLLREARIRVAEVMVVRVSHITEEHKVGRVRLGPSHHREAASSRPRKQIRNLKLSTRKLSLGQNTNVFGAMISGQASKSRCWDQKKDHHPRNGQLAVQLQTSRLEVQHRHNGSRGQTAKTTYLTH